MNLKIHTGSSRSQKSTARGSNGEDIYLIVRGKSGRSFGRAKRSYGQVNLKVDPSLYLSLKNPLEIDLDTWTVNKFTNDLNDLANSRKGCIVWYSLEYFKCSDKVVPYVDTLLGKCLNEEYIMEVTTKNFVLLSNIVTYGEKIKTQMFNSLLHIHQDLLSFGQTDKSELNPQLFLKYYDHNITIRYYKFVSLLYFRFRKHLDSYRRYKSLASPALAAINYLLTERSIDSLVLLTKLVLLNLHSLSKWFYEEVMMIVDDIKGAWEQYKTSDQEKWYWLSGTLDIIYQGPVLPRSLYNRYTELLGVEWVENVVQPPVQVLERPNEYIIAEKLDCLHINDDDVIRNMYVYLP